MRLLPLLALLLLSCTPEVTIEVIDDDADGWDSSEDCDDLDATAFPGAEELCDGVDNDCDGVIDERAGDASTWYRDAEGDTFGSDADTIVGCEAPAGYTVSAGDCDDGDDDTNPDADEICDHADNDCDGYVDEDDALDALDWFLDDDGDGWGVEDEVVSACDAPAHYVANDGDCDDDDPAIHPGAPEFDCTDPTDYNCDGSVGYEDADADGFAACEDCDDEDDTTHPDGVEVCDEADNDCNGLVDDGVDDPPTWYADADGDGFAGDALVLVQCAQPPGYHPSPTDCDDLDPSSFPGGTEVCDGADNDCDTDVDEGVGSTWYADADGDGYGDPLSPTVACDQPFGYVANFSDCDDSMATSNPASYEVCDGADNDCDGYVDEPDAIDALTFWLDADTDGYGVETATETACSAPTGFADNADDCDDTDPGVHPAAVEICNDADDDCDGLVDDDAVGGATWYVDGDSDGYGVADTVTVDCDQPIGFVDNADDCDDADPASTIVPDDGDCDGTLTADDCDDADDASTIVAEDGDCDGALTADDCDDADPASTIVAEDGDCDGAITAEDCDDADPTSTTLATDFDCDTWLTADDCDDTNPSVFPGAPEIPGDGIDSDCDGFDDPQNFSGIIEMTSSGMVNGFSGGPWGPLNGGGRAVSRVILTQACVNPQLALYQHPDGDTSIQGAYFVLDEAGNELDSTAFQTYSGCSDCWLPHPGRLSVTMAAGTNYWIGLANGSGGDMCCPGIYNDATPRTEGIATFDSPRADKPATPAVGLPATSVSWQNRWRIDCE